MSCTHLTDTLLTTDDGACANHSPLFMFWYVICLCLCLGLRELGLKVTRLQYLSSITKNAQDDTFRRSEETDSNDSDL